MAKGRETRDNLGEKRRLLDSLEAMRRPAETGGDTAAVTGLPSLTERLRRSEAAATLLREEVKQLERQALDAIGEVGRLRRLLDQRDRSVVDPESVEGLRVRLSRAEGENAMLTGALADSENEIARMTRTLDIVARKLNLAV